MQTIEQLARDIVAEPIIPFSQYNSVTRQSIWKAAAQAYLDNLESGCDDPAELVELLAEDFAAENMPESFSERDEAGYSWHDGPYSEDEWLADKMPGYLAAVRSTYGMGDAA